MQLDEFVQIQAQPVNAREIVAFRTRMGWSQSKLASALGSNQTSVARWETGQTMCRGAMAKLFRTVERLADEQTETVLEEFEVIDEPLASEIWQRISSRPNSASHSGGNGLIAGFVLHAPGTDDVVTLRPQPMGTRVPRVGDEVRYEHGRHRSWEVIAVMAANLEIGRVVQSTWADTLHGVAERFRQQLWHHEPQSHRETLVVTGVFCGSAFRDFFDSQATREADLDSDFGIYVFDDDGRVVSVQYVDGSWELVEGRERVDSSAAEARND